MHRPLSSFHSLKFLIAALVVSAGLVSTIHPVFAEAVVQTPTAAQQAVIDENAKTDAAAKTAATTPANTTQDLGDKALGFFAYYASMLALFLGNLVVSVIGVLIPIMQYQGFTSSLVVSSGWAIVRDVVNMFFVVVLIVIAMGTIFGSSKFTWRQQVPALMIMAIVINFSKTLCGLMIDFAQVVMLTFANALKDIAGGNFIQLLGMGPIFQTSSLGPVSAGSFDLFAAALAAVLMMLIVLSVVLMMLAILVYRVVMLWILIVVAPLAWFTKVIPFEAAQGAWGEWWKSFVCYCSVGPVLTFFLWLTLAVAGAGSIAANDPGFSSVGLNEYTNTASGLSVIFELEHLTSFIIGIALLMAGIDAAGKVCAGAAGGAGMSKMMGQLKGGGFVARALRGDKSAIGGSTMSKAGGKMKMAGAAVAGFAANEIVTKSGMKGMAAGALRGTSKAVGAMNIPIISGMAQEKLGGMAGKIDKSGEEQGKESAKGLVEGDQQTQMDYLKNLAGKGKVPFLATEKNKAMAVYQDALKDKEKRKVMEDSKDKDGKSDFAKLQEMFEPEMKKAPAGSEARKSLKEINRTRPDLGTEAQVAENIERISKENIGEVDAPAYTDKNFRDKAASITTDRVKSTTKDDEGNDVYTYYNELEAAQNGWRGQLKQKASTGPTKDGKPYSPPETTLPTTTPTSDAPPADVPTPSVEEPVVPPATETPTPTPAAPAAGEPAAGAGSPAAGTAPVAGADGAAGAGGTTGATGAGGIGGAGGAGGAGGKGGRGGKGGSGMPGLAPSIEIPGSPAPGPSTDAPPSASGSPAKSAPRPRSPAPSPAPDPKPSDTPSKPA